MVRWSLTGPRSDQVVRQGARPESITMIHEQTPGAGVSLEFEEFEESTADCPLRVGALWPLLVQGKARVVNVTQSQESSILVVERLKVPAVPLDQRTVCVLERLLSGESQKACAIDVGLAVSTITMLAKRGLREIGVECLPSRAPLLLAILVCASRERTALHWTRVREIESEGTRFLFFAFPPPNALLPAALSGALRAVATLLLEGKQYREIAAERRTSIRTVANQAAAVFQRLKVSGRNQLLAQAANSVPPVAPVAIHVVPAMS
jgi:DNA-binding CsgD family transcriptional regulator